MNKSLPWWLIAMLAPRPWPTLPDQLFHRWFDYVFGLIYGLVTFGILSWLWRRRPDASAEVDR